MNNKAPLNHLTLTLERPRERERRESKGGYPGPWEDAGEEDRPRRGLRRPEEVRDGGGGGGSKGGEHEQEIGVGVE
jgi:hypothetical protein